MRVWTASLTGRRRVREYFRLDVFWKNRVIGPFYTLRYGIV